MNLTKEQRLDIGRRVYNQEISHTEASIQYGIALTSVNRYVHDYKVSIGVSTEQRISGKNKASSVKQPDTSSIDIEAYRAMSNAPSIVFIDEFDELVMTTDFRSDYSRKTTKILLTEIDGISSSDGILVIATTNYCFFRMCT